MTDPPFMRLSDFDYVLPDELIAQHPPTARGDSRLLVVNPPGSSNEVCVDQQFSQLHDWLRPGDVLIGNNTRVVKARGFGTKPTGGRVEFLIERVLGDDEALAMVKTSKGLAEGARFNVEGGELEMLGRDGDFFKLRLIADIDWWTWLERHGSLPLPPYITHAADSADEARYQTVYGQHPGAVAAPTAGLHFTDAMLNALSEQGVERHFVTLHVGAGTFQPVRVDDVSQHTMHSERYWVSEQTASAVNRARAEGRRIVAIGTTSLRALEAASNDAGELIAGESETRLFITPGYPFKAVDALITNFHLPKSTLLMLVSAFAGRESIRAAYAHAIANQYRFFSYGDAMLLHKIQIPSPSGRGLG